MNPAELYKGIALRLSLAAPELGVDAAYVEGFLARNHRAMKTVLLENWPGLPLPKWEEYRRCNGCGNIEHYTRLGPHTAIMGLPCIGTYGLLARLGMEPMGDFTFAGLLSNTVARWGMCEVCGGIYRVSRRDLRLIQHTRPLNPETDGRKRKDPDCEGGHTIPAAISRPHPRQAEALAEIERIYAASKLYRT